MALRWALGNYDPRMYWCELLPRRYLWQYSVPSALCWDVPCWPRWWQKPRVSGSSVIDRQTEFRIEAQLVHWKELWYTILTSFGESCSCTSCTNCITTSLFSSLSNTNQRRESRVSFLCVCVTREWNTLSLLTHRQVTSDCLLDTATSRVSDRLTEIVKWAGNFSPTQNNVNETLYNMRPFPAHMHSGNTTKERGMDYVSDVILTSATNLQPFVWEGSSSTDNRCYKFSSS